MSHQAYALALGAIATAVPAYAAVSITTNPGQNGLGMIAFVNDAGNFLYNQSNEFNRAPGELFNGGPVNSSFSVGFSGGDIGVAGIDSASLSYSATTEMSSGGVAWNWDISSSMVTNTPVSAPLTRFAVTQQAMFFLTADSDTRLRFSFDEASSSMAQLPGQSAQSISVLVGSPTGTIAPLTFGLDPSGTNPSIIEDPFAFELDVEAGDRFVVAVTTSIQIDNTSAEFANGWDVDQRGGFSVTVVPAPAGVSVALAGGLLAARRRRR